MKLMTRQYRKFAGIAAIALAISLMTACISLDIDGVTLCEGDTWSQTTLYLGRGIQGAAINDDVFRSFIEDEVTPRFPSGFTLLHGQGAWKNTGLQRTIYEGSSMLVVLHPGTSANRQALRNIAGAYRTRFHQQAVIEARHQTCVSFITE
jgi:hypothetical protein